MGTELREPWKALGISQGTWAILTAEQAQRGFVPGWRQHLWYRASRLLERLGQRVLRWSRYCLLKANNW